jgi:hypothetical protein
MAPPGTDERLRLATFNLRRHKAEVKAPPALTAAAKAAAHDCVPIEEGLTYV